MEILNLTEDTVTIGTVAAALENLAAYIPAGMALIRIKPISSLRHRGDGTGKVEWYLLAVFRSAGSEDLDADHQMGIFPLEENVTGFTLLPHPIKGRSALTQFGLITSLIDFNVFCLRLMEKQKT